MCLLLFNCVSRIIFGDVSAMLAGIGHRATTAFDTSPAVFFVMGSFHAVEFDFQVQRDHDC
jgi:hypothetical protein